MNAEGGGGQLQDEFLQRVRKEGKLVAIYLVGGVKLSGRVKGFDRFTVLLESKEQDQLIFKHAISTITLVRGEARRPDAERRPGADAPES